MKTLVLALINYYQENEDDFDRDIEELDAWNGYLGDDRCYPIDELNELLQGNDIDRILAMAYYGRDDDSWHEENGEKVYDSFCPNREYFYFNGYGNLVSTDCPDYTCHLDEYAVQDIIDNASHLNLSDGAQDIINNYEDNDNDGEVEN